MGGAPRHPLVHAFPVPDGISDEAAVLSDPFSVSFHAIVRNPPPPGGKVVVYGAGALGLASVAILHALYPGVEVAGGGPVPGPGGQGPGVRRLGGLRPRAATTGAGGAPRRAGRGGPASGPRRAAHGPIPATSMWSTTGLAKPETFEVGVRVLAERATGLHRCCRTWPVGVDSRLLQGSSTIRGFQRLRHGGVRGGPTACRSSTIWAWSETGSISTSMVTPTRHPGGSVGR